MNKDKQEKGKLISFWDSNMKLLVSMYRTENDKQLHLPLSRVMSATHAEETSCISRYHCMSNVLFPRGYKQERIIMTKIICPYAYGPGVYSKRENQSRMCCIKRLKSSMKDLSNPNKALMILQLARNN